MRAIRQVVIGGLPRSAVGDRKADEGSEGRTPSAEGLRPQAEGRLVIFVDEIDAVRSTPFSTDEFFAGIRECYNRRTHDPGYQLGTSCVLGAAPPSDLVKDPRTPPFNIGRRIELTDFTEAEAAPLAEGLRPSPPSLPDSPSPPVERGTGGEVAQRLLH